MRLRSGKTISYPNDKIFNENKYKNINNLRFSVRLAHTIDALQGPQNQCGYHLVDNMTTNNNNLNHNIYKNRNKSLDYVFDTINNKLKIIENNKNHFIILSKHYWVKQCIDIIQLYTIMSEYYEDIYEENKNRPGTIKLLNISARKALRLLSDISHVYNKHTTPLMKYKIMQQFNNYERALMHNCIKYLIFYVKKSRENNLLRIM